MGKKITKEQVIDTALELMKNSNHLNSLNLRAVARALGCAHTNLYNYFSSYSDLLWEVHAVMQGIFIENLANQLETVTTVQLRYDCFFRSIVDFYMENKGWFRLAWIEYIEGERPENDIKVTETTNRLLNDHIANIWNELYGEHLEKELTKRVMHNTHCYLIGEISNYLMGRGLIEDEMEFKQYVANEAAHMFKLCVMNPS